MTPRVRGQALVEFALTMPLFMVFVFALVEIALLFIWFYSETSVARDTGRWLAVHGNSSDASVATHVLQSLPAGMIGATPVQLVAGTTTTDTQYRVGNMTVTFTPCLPTGTPVTCSHPSRAPGSTLHVQMSYDVSNIIFLPTRFQLGWMSATIPTTLPPYTVYVMTE
jgi:Flp pilus assembly protein TadG